MPVIKRIINAFFTDLAVSCYHSGFQFGEQIISVLPEALGVIKSRVYNENNTCEAFSFNNILKEWRVYMVNYKTVVKTNVSYAFPAES